MNELLSHSVENVLDTLTLTASKALRESSRTSSKFSYIKQKNLIARHSTPRRLNKNLFKS